MLTAFIPLKTPEAWQLSNPQILSMTGLLSSLDIFEKTTIKKLRNKSELLTSYMEFLINNNFDDKIKIITPKSLNERGCQLSLIINTNIHNIIDKLISKGVICDFRPPNILRIAPVPLYNTFSDCYNFINILKKVIN